jgi:DNA-binding LacI/PurR family transcriptional regulator
LAGTRRARIADVARTAGVSKASVSFAFNSPERLSDETVTRIRDVAAALGYRPHPVARMLTARQTSTIGILTPQSLAQVFRNPFFASFAEGVAAVTEEVGFGLLFISPLHGSLERALERATVDGVVVVGLEQDHPEVEIIRQAGLPMVVVDAPAWEEHGAVVVDDEGGARAAADHLLALGHRDLLALTIGPAEAGAPPSTGGVVGRRLAGYRQALAAAGQDPDGLRTVAAEATFEAGSAAFDDVWATGARPTAVLAMSDAIAVGVLLAAHRLGLRVPEDLSVVGFDDLPVSELTAPPLTTVHQPVREKGVESARLLLGAITGAAATPARPVVLETHLVVRGSTAAPRIGA